MKRIWNIVNLWMLLMLGAGSAYAVVAEDYVVLEHDGHYACLPASPAGSNRPFEATDDRSNDHILFLLETGRTGGTLSFRSVNYPDYYVGYPTNRDPNAQGVVNVNNNANRGSYIFTPEDTNYRLQDKDWGGVTTLYLHIQEDATRLVGGVNTGETGLWTLHTLTPYTVTITTNGDYNTLTCTEASQGHLYGSSPTQYNDGIYYFESTHTPVEADFEAAPMGYTRTLNINTSAHTITVAYTQTPYAVYWTQPEHATITVGGQTESPLTTYYGREVFLGCTPESGYGLQEWVVTNTDTHERIPVANGSFLMPAANVTVSATISQNFNVEVVPSLHGSVAASPAENITAGTTITLTATPDAGYEVAEWSVATIDGAPVAVSTTPGNNTATFTMPGSSVRATATFSMQVVDYTVVLQVDGAAAPGGFAGGLISSDPSVTIVGSTLRVPYDHLPLESHSTMLHARKVNGYSSAVSISDEHRIVTVNYTTYGYTIRFGAVPSGQTVTAYYDATELATWTSDGAAQSPELHKKIAIEYMTRNHILATTVTVGETVYMPLDIVVNGRDILINYEQRELSDYIVRITSADGEEDIPTRGALILSNQRYINGSLVNLSGISGTVGLSAEPLTNQAAAITRNETDHRVEVVYSRTPSTETARITYHIYYEGTYMWDITIDDAPVGERIPNLDGLNAYGLPVASPDRNKLPYRIYQSEHNLGICEGETTITLNTTYQGLLPFYPDRTRYHEISNWMAANIGADTQYRGNVGGTEIPATDWGGTLSDGPHYIYYRDGIITIDATRRVLKEGPTDTESTYASVLTQLSEGYYWAFIGNPYKFRLMNRAAGAAKYLRWNYDDPEHPEDGYWSFDSEGTYFTAAINTAVTPGAYTDYAGFDWLGQHFDHPDAEYGVTVLLYDYVARSLSEGATVHGVAFTVEADGHITMTEAGDHIHSTQYHVYTSSLAATPAAMNYTVRVAVPGGATLVGGIYYGGEYKTDGTTISVVATPRASNLTAIDVAGYDAILSIDHTSRTIIVTYLSNTDYSDYYYMRNYGLWSGYYIDQTELGSATADPRRAALVRLIPAGRFDARIGSMGVVNVPCFYIWEKDEFNPDGTWWTDNWVVTSADNAERYFLIDIEGHPLEMTHFVHNPLDRPFAIVNVNALEAGLYHLIGWNQSPYAPGGNEQIGVPYTSDRIQDFLWRFQSGSTPLFPVTVDIQQYATTGATAYTDAYLQWGTRPVGYGDKIYGLVGDEAFTGVSAPNFRSAGALRRMTGVMDYSRQRFTATYFDYNIVSTYQALQDLSTSGDYVQIVHADDRGVLRADAVRNPTIVHLQGAVNIEGSSLADPYYMELCGIYNTETMWHVIYKNSRYYLQNAASGYYLTTDSEDRVVLTDVETPLESVTIDGATGMITFRPRADRQTVLGVDLSREESAVAQMADGSMASKWYICSRRTKNYTVLSNIGSGGIRLNLSGMEYHLYDQVVLSADLDNATLAAYATPIEQADYTLMDWYVAGNYIVVRYELRFDAAKRYAIMPSYTTSPWFTFEAARGDNSSGGALMASFYTIGAVSESCKPAYMHFVDQGTLADQPDITLVDGKYTLSYGALDHTTKTWSIPGTCHVEKIRVEDRGYVRLLAGKGTALSAGNTFYYDPNEEAGENFLFVPATEFYKLCTGFSFYYDTEFFIIPMSSLGHTDTYNGYTGQLILSYQGMLGDHDTYPLGLGVLCDISRTSEAGAVNRRNTYAFEVAPITHTGSVSANITGLPSSITTTTPLVNIDGVKLRPGETATAAGIILEDTRIHPVDGYHYRASVDNNKVLVDYTPGRHITRISELRPNKIYTLRSVADLGYLAVNTPNWTLNYAVEKAKAMTIVGSWNDDYRVQTIPADYTDPNLQWIIVPRDEDYLSGNPTAIDIYLGNIGIHEMVFGHGTGGDYDPWYKSENLIATVRLEEAAGGKFRLKSGDYYLHVPAMSTGKFGYVGDMSPNPDPTSDYDKWIIEETEFERVYPRYEVLIKGIYESIADHTDLAVSLHASEMQQTTISSFPDHRGTAVISANYQYADIRVPDDIVFPAGSPLAQWYDISKTEVSHEGYTFTLTFTETLAHLILRADSYLYGWKNDYGYPVESVKNALQTAVDGVRSGEDNETNRATLLGAINTFLAAMENASNIILPYDKTGTKDELFVVYNYATHRYVTYVEEGSDPYWSDEPGVSSYFYSTGHVDIGGGLQMYTLFTASGLMRGAIPYSHFITGHPDWKGTIIAVNPLTGLPFADPWDRPRDDDDPSQYVMMLRPTSLPAGINRYNTLAVGLPDYARTDDEYECFLTYTPAEPKIMLKRVRVGYEGEGARKGGFFLLSAEQAVASNFVATTYRGIPEPTITVDHTEHLITVTYTTPTDYYYQLMREDIAAAVAVWEAHAGSAYSASPYVVKGYGEPTIDVLTTYHSQIDALITKLNGFESYPSGYTSEMYTADTHSLSSYTASFLATTQVRKPEPGEIIAITGVIDAPVLEANRTNLLHKDGTVLRPETRTSATRRANDYLWIVRPGASAGTVYLESAFGDGFYLTQRGLAHYPQGWTFSAGTRLGRMSMFYEASMARFVTTDSLHRFGNGVMQKEQQADYSTDFELEEDRLSHVFTVRIYLPAAYANQHPGVTIADASYKAQSPIYDGGIVVFAEELFRDLPTEFFIPENITNLTCSVSIDETAREVNVVYTENINALRERLYTDLQNARSIQLIGAPDGLLYSAALSDETAEALKTANTAEELYTAMENYYRSPSVSFYARNLKTEQWLSTKNSVSVGGTYLGMVADTIPSELTTYQLLYGGGTEDSRGQGYYYLYNPGYGNYIAHTYGEGARATSTTDIARAGLYTLTHTTGGAIYLTCVNSGDVGTNILLHESTDTYNVMTGDLHDGVATPDLEWNLYKTTGASVLPLPGNYYYVQRNGTDVKRTDKTNGNTYTENTTDKESNPAFLFYISRVGHSYVVSNMAGGYLQKNSTTATDTYTLLTVDDLQKNYTFESYAVTPLADQLLQLYRTSSQYPIGNKVGQYKNGEPSLTGSNGAASTGVKAEVREKLASTVTQADIDRLRTAIDALTICQPTSTFFRIKNRLTGKYLTMEDGVNESNMRLKAYNPTLDFSGEKGAYTLFWLQNKDDQSGPVYENNQFKILGYSNGQYMQSTFLLTSAAYQSSASKFTFSKSANGEIGCYNIKSDAIGDNYLATTSSSSIATMSNQADVLGTDWELEQVNEIPVSIGAAGYATLHLPVSTTIPSSGIGSDGSTVAAPTVKYASVVTPQSMVDAKIGTLTLVTISSTLPAYTPVILQGTANSTYLFTITDGGSTPADNKLSGTFSTQTQADWKQTHTSGELFVLMKGKINNVETIGFFRDYIGNLKGFRAVLMWSNSGSAPCRGLIFEDAPAGPNVATDINVPTPERSKPIKIFRDGQLLILREGHLYDLRGTELL